VDRVVEAVVAEAAVIPRVAVVAAVIPQAEVVAAIRAEEEPRMWPHRMSRHPL
jgi:hypothetical protein